jgi:hypothetical protein
MEQSLQLFNCGDIINFRHPTSGLFMWIYLRLLQLDNCACRNDTLVRFLEFHKDTLTQIYTSDINLMSGSWRQPLQSMETMSKLEEMCLGSLYETTRPSKDGLSFDQFYNLEEQEYQLRHFELCNNDRICVVINATFYDFRTKDDDPDMHYHGTLLFTVDFRLAKAIAEGKAELRHGECRLLL